MVGLMALFFLGAFAAIYLIVDENNNVYCIADSLYPWRYDSSNVYARIQIGHTYHCELYGWRIPFLSWWQNAMNIYEIS